MSDLLRFVENEVQLAALAFMAVVYTIRVVWIIKFKTVRERTFPAGRPSRGVGYALMSVAMPWAMESTRKRPVLYAQFVIFHLGVAATIAVTFLIPYAPRVLESRPLVLAFQSIMAASLAVGLMRLIRRLSNPVLRLVSSADDYFSLSLLTVFFAAGILAVPNRYEQAEWPLLLFFGLTAFFLLYVPFSKIGHYLYYPFARALLGRALGHRGAWPPSGRPRERSIAPASKVEGRTG